MFIKKILILGIHYTLLGPLSFLIKIIHRIRRFAYNYGMIKVQYFEVPIISVGNLALGGTGKTPFTLWLSHYLNSLNKKILILSRGYKGNLEHKSGLLRSGEKFTFDPVEHGDEPLMMARELRHGGVVVGKNRDLNLKYFFEDESPDVVLLDDGHQYLRLGRKMNIVMFDALMPIDKYKVFPLGYLREEMATLKNVDIVIIGHCDLVKKEDLATLKELIHSHLEKDTLIIEMYYKSIGFFDKNHQFVLKPEEIKSNKVICVSGVASPASFFSMIEQLGGIIAAKHTFPDHHYYTTKELVPIIQKAKENNLRIITTEKDIVKIRNLSGLQKEDGILYLKIDLGFINGEKEIKEKIQTVL